MKSRNWVFKSDCEVAVKVMLGCHKSLSSYNEINICREQVRLFCLWPKLSSWMQVIWWYAVTKLKTQTKLNSQWDIWNPIQSTYLHFKLMLSILIILTILSLRQCLLQMMVSPAHLYLFIMGTNMELLLNFGSLCVWTHVFYLFWI